MKRILGIALALSMMTSTAFASTTQILNPGSSITFQMSDFVDETVLYYTGTSGTDWKISNKPFSGNDKGKEYKNSRVLGTKADTHYTGVGIASSNKPEEKVAADKYVRQDIAAYEFTATNFTVTYNAPVGRNYIKNYEFDGIGKLSINLKSDYKLPSTGKPDMVLTDVTVRSRKDIKKIGSSEVALYRNRTFSAKAATGGEGTNIELGDKGIFFVGIEAAEEFLTPDSEVDLVSHSIDGEWIKFVADGAYTGTVSYDDGNIVIKSKVYAGDVVNFVYDTMPNDLTIKVIQNNPLEANIQVHNIIAKNFKTGFTVAIPDSAIYGAEADAEGNVNVLSGVAANRKRIYLLSSKGVLTAASFVYNSVTGTWNGRVPAQGGTILISDMALRGVAAGGGNGGNGGIVPDTGMGIDFSSAVIR